MSYINETKNVLYEIMQNQFEECLQYKNSSHVFNKIIKPLSDVLSFEFITILLIFN